MWTLLARGDERAKDFFLGEFDVNAKDPNGGRTPLHYAAELDHPGLAAFFIAMGAEVDAQDNAGQTPLGICADRNTVKVTGILVNNGADIHKPARGGISPAKTSLNGKDQFLQALLNPVTINAADSDGKTLLHLASETGNIAAVKTILAAIEGMDGVSNALVAAGNRNSPIDKKDAKGQNPLDIAYSRPDSRDHMEIAEQLVLSGAISENRINTYFAPAARNANYDLRRADGQAPLHYAAAEGHEGLIKFLIEKKANINIKNSSGAAPLHEAARSGNVNVMKLLLDNGADINAQDAKGNSPLHIAVPPEDHTGAIKLFLAEGADPNLRDEHGDSPLHVLITLNRDPEVVQALLAGGPGGWVDTSVRNVNGQTPLHLAVQERRVQLIPLLISSGADIFAADNYNITPFDTALRIKGDIIDALITQLTAQQKDSAGNTMLHIAVRNRADTVIVGKILAQDIPVNARNREGDTALHIAARMNSKEAGEYVLSRNGADIFSFNSSGENPLYIALTHPSGVLQWMFNPRTAASRDGQGNSMLHYVALWQMDSVIRYIIQRGVPVDAANATGETPLFWAVKYDGASTVTALLSAEADLHARDSLGNSALHAAVRWNAKNATNTLLGAGIDVNVHNLNGTTPLHDSVRLGLNDIALTLLDWNADIEVRDSAGNTPFMEAVKAGYVSSVNLLASKGASAMTRNSNGDTPLHYAAAAENENMIQVLLNMGVSIHARNTKNRTPFQVALTESPKMVSALLTRERVNSPDDYGNSPLHVAVLERVPASTLQVIIDRGTRLNSVDSNGRIPLRLAVDIGAWDSAQVLADAGSNPFSVAVDNKTPAEIAIATGNDAIRSIFSGKAIDAKDPSGNTVLHYAARMGKPDEISLLLELGASKSVRNISSESPADVAIRWNNGANAALLN